MQDELLWSVLTVYVFKILRAESTRRLQCRIFTVQNISTWVSIPLADVMFPWWPLWVHRVLDRYLCRSAGFWRESLCLSRGHTANQIVRAVGGIFYRSMSPSPPPTASRPPYDDCGLCFWWPPVVLFVLVLNLSHWNDQGVNFNFGVNSSFNHRLRTRRNHKVFMWMFRLSVFCSSQQVELRALGFSRQTVSWENVQSKASWAGVESESRDNGAGRDPASARWSW